MYPYKETEKLADMLCTLDWTDKDNLGVVNFWDRQADIILWFLTERGWEK